jgi:hypothetical protein
MDFEVAAVEGRRDPPALFWAPGRCKKSPPNWRACGARGGLASPGCQRLPLRDGSVLLTRLAPALFFSPHSSPSRCLSLHPHPVSHLCLSSGCAIKYASHELKQDEDVVRVALGNADPSAGGDLLRYAHADLRGDRDLVMHAVTVCCNGNMLRHASDELRDDRDVVLLATRKHGENLKYATFRLRGDAAVVSAAAQTAGWKFAMKFASAALQDDREFVKYAVNSERRSTARPPATPWPLETGPTCNC